MMNILAAIFVVVTQLILSAFTQETDNDTTENISFSYIEGTEYVYRYHGVISSGFPRIKPQDSGYEFSALLRVQPEGNDAIFKVEDFKGTLFNGNRDDTVWESHEFKDPFRVYRKNGLVTHFEVSKEESLSCVNFKRGIISLFSLNLDPVEAGPSTDENDIVQTDPNSHYYKVYEDTLLGECETAYVIEHHPHDLRSNNVLNVTKVRNFHKCKTRPNQVYSVFYGKECGEADHMKSHTLHGNAQYNYKIRGDRQHYVIEKITMESDVAYTPYPLEGQTVSTLIKRSLELMEEKPVSESLVMSGDLIDVTSVIYDFDYQKEFNEPVDLKMPHYFYHLTGKKVPITDVRKQMEELVHMYNDESYAERIREKNSPSRFVELLRSVATLGYEEIEELYKAYADIPEKGATEEQKHYKNLFIDILVNLGTNPAFLFGKHLVEDKKVGHREAVYFVQQLQFHVKEVSETLLDSLQELCDHENVKSNPSLHLACIFTLSNIVFDHCVAKYHPEGIQEGKSVCPHEAAVKYFNNIARLYEESQDEKLKYNYIKAMGNIGVKELIPHLKPYLEGQTNSDKFDRENAIWALKHVGKRYPEKVKTLLASLFFNRTESYELRLAAFVLLLHMKPQLYEIEGMARALKQDPDTQVKAFVYSTLKRLSNSTHICDSEVSKYARYALRIMEDFHSDFDQFDYTYSSNYYFAGYDPDYDFGGSTRFAYLASDTGYIPRSVYLGFGDYIGGKSMGSFGFGIKQFGLEKIIDRIFGPEGSFDRKSVFDHFKKREKRDTSSVQEELKEIKEKLNLPIHDYDRIKGDIFFKYMGNYISSFQFDEKFFEQFFKDGRFEILNIPEIYKTISSFVYQRFTLSVDKLYVIPTDFGIPLFFDYKQPHYYYHKNKDSSFRVEPGFFTEDRDGSYPDHVRAETDGHFAFDKQLIAYTGVLLPFGQVIFGAGVNKRTTLSLPLKVKMDLAMKERKLSTHWTPVAPHEVFHFKYEPFTFIDSFSNSVPQVLEEGYLPVKKVHRHEFQKSFLHDALGFGFNVRANYENEFNDFGSWVDFFLKKDFREKFYYLYSNPKFEPYDINVEFTYAGQDATKEVETDISYNFYENDWIIPHFPEESFEDFKTQKEDRGHLSTTAIKANIVAKGDKERKIHAVASWTRSLNFKFHKINFYYERRPFTQKETENFKICGSSNLIYHDLEGGNIDELDTLNMDPIVNTDLKLYFGKNCNDDQKINIQGQISKSDESLQMERQREEPDTPEYYNLFSYYYQGCLKERQRGVITNGDYCSGYFKLFRMLHKYRFHIKYANLSPNFLNTTYLLDRVLNFMYFTHSDINEVDVHNSVDEVLIEANFSYNRPVGDFRIQKPLSTTYYNSVLVPGYSGFNLGPEVADPMYTHRYCAIESGDNVRTFDNYEYSMPSIDCWRLMVKDCSPNEYFTVLESKVNHPKYNVSLKMFLGNHKIEHLADIEKSEMITTLDGKELTISDSEPYLHYEGDEKPHIFSIHYGEPYFTLRSEKYGIIFERIGETITIFVTPFYRSKLCGLCGNYNGQKYDETSTENGCHFANEKDYAYAFSISSETCSVPKPDPICRN